MDNYNSFLSVQIKSLELWPSMWGKGGTTCGRRPKLHSPTCTPTTTTMPTGSSRLMMTRKYQPSWVSRQCSDLWRIEWLTGHYSCRYVIVENLRYMLSPYDASHPLWFGCRFKKFAKQGYMSGGTVHNTSHPKHFSSVLLSHVVSCHVNCLPGSQ